MTKSTLKKLRREKPKEIYGLAKSLVGDPPQVAIYEMTDVEVYAIGQITVQWAYLEHILLIDTARRVNNAKLKEMPEYADSLSFKKRLAAWRQIIQETVKSPKRRTELSNLGHRIANLESDRHKITHGLWAYRQSRPEKLIAYSFRPTVEFIDRKFSADRLYKLSDRIAALNFILTNPAYPKKTKKRDRYLARQMFGSGSFVSRRFLLTARGKESGTLVPLEATHQAQPRQQSSAPASPNA